MPNIDPTSLGHVALIIGGESAERGISLNSGAYAASQMQQAGVPFTTIDASGAELVEALCSKKFDRAMLLLHGGKGEDGTVQALLDILKIPYTSPGHASSALAMDKMRSKWVWQALGLPVAPACIVGQESHEPFVRKHGYPLAVKPIHDGSSLGVNKVSFENALSSAIAEAAFFGPVMIEKWIDGPEYSVSIVGDHIFPSLKVVAKDSEFVDFNAKYSTQTVRQCPSDLDETQELTITALAKSAFEAVGARCWGRVDIILEKQTGQFYLLEINAVPGITRTSQLPIAARAYGWTDAELVLELLALAEYTGQHADIGTIPSKEMRTAGA